MVRSSFRARLRGTFFPTAARDGSVFSGRCRARLGRVLWSPLRSSWRPEIALWSYLLFLTQGSGVSLGVFDRGKGESLFHFAGRILVFCSAVEIRGTFCFFLFFSVRSSGRHFRGGSKLDGCVFAMQFGMLLLIGLSRLLC